MTDIDVQGLFERLAVDLEPRGVLPGALFGARSLSVDGTAFACLKGDRLAVRLGAGSPLHADALALPGSELFDPSGKGRPFQDWVAIPTASSEQWAHFVEAGLRTVTAG